MQKKNLYLLLLILGTPFLCVSFSLVKIGIGIDSPFLFIFYKFLIAFLCIAVVFYSQLMFSTWITVRIVLLIGVTLLFGTILQTVNLHYTSVSNSAFITGLDVLMIPIFKSLVYKKKPQSKIWLP